MGSAPVQDLPDGSVSTRVWQRSDDGPVIIEQHFTHGEDAPFAGYTCDDCPQPHVTTAVEVDMARMDYTQRCRSCERRYAARKRSRRWGELLLHEQPEGTAIAVITLTFADEDINKYATPEALRKESIKRHRRLREKNTFWRENVVGGISSFEFTHRDVACPETGKKRRRYHPHLHLVAYVVGGYPYDIEGLREAAVAGGFGPTFRIETAYTKEPIKDKEGNFRRDAKGKVITRKVYSNPEGAVFYATKYVRKDSFSTKNEGKGTRTVTRFGCLMGKKWTAAMNPRFEQVVRRYHATHGEGRLNERAATRVKQEREDRATRKRDPWSAYLVKGDSGSPQA